MRLILCKVIHFKSRAQQKLIEDFTVDYFEISEITIKFRSHSTINVLIAQRLRLNKVNCDE